MQTFSTGFNFYEVFNNPSDPNTRTVTKRYGIKLEFGVSGRAGQFSAVATMIALGSGLALLSIASIVTDFVLSHYWHGAEQYLAIRNAELDEHKMNAKMERARMAAMADGRPSMDYDQPLMDDRNKDMPSA